MIVGNGATTVGGPFRSWRVVRPSAVIHIGVRAGHAAVVMEGVVSEPDVASWLMPLIGEVHREAVRIHESEVVLDLRKLEYANAALWKCIVSWLKMLKEDASAHYSLRIVPDATHRWQEVGLPMLRVFGGNRVILEL